MCKIKSNLEYSLKVHFNLPLEKFDKMGLLFKDKEFSYVYKNTPEY
jgi:hypothetical protein